jgi:competence protein ComEC
LQISFFDVGQGDSILVVSPDGKTMLIDGGEPDTGIVQYLQGMKINRIDVMVASHPHADHIGGLVQVLKTIPVTEVITNGEPTTTNIYEQFLDGIANAKAKYTEVKKGDTIPLGNLTFDVLAPGVATGDLNSDSIVLRLTYGKTSVMFMGDADAAAESAILASGSPVKADILKVGHHGSKYSSSVAFLKAVSPAVAVYSAGLGNSYGHPATQTIANLQNVGAQIYGTDKDGTITVSIDANGYKINTSKIAARAPPTPTAGVIVAPGILSLEIVSVTNPVDAGSFATLQARTLPGADCDIAVYYKSGASVAQGLNPKNAGSDGMVSWTWKVGSRTSSGSWRIVVMASLNGQSITQETHFTVK